MWWWMVCYVCKHRYRKLELELLNDLVNNILDVGIHATLKNNNKKNIMSMFIDLYFSNVVDL